MTDADALRCLEAWFAARPQAITLGGEQWSADAVRAALLRSASALESREMLRADLATAERERVDATARANAALIKAGDEAGRLREELSGVYAMLGRITIAEWQARRGAADE